MGLFDLFNKSTGRFVPEEAHKKNLASQLSMTPQTLQQLRKLGVDPERRLKVEVFFYSDQLSKVEALAEALRGLQYEMETRPAANDDGSFLATGWTAPISMANDEMREWTERMCTLGYQHDCDFDGWGTNPNQ